MAKVATPSPRLRQNARNVTWDFMHILWRHSFTGHNDRQRGFLIPYFLTFDRGLADLYDIYPQRSCLFGNELEYPLFYPEMDLRGLVIGSFPQLESVFYRVFSFRGAEERRRHGVPNPSEIAGIAAELEQQLAKFENWSEPSDSIP